MPRTVIVSQVKPSVLKDSDSVRVQFGSELELKLTEAQAWALQNDLRNALSPSAANHKCPTCGGLGAPTHPCPRTGLSCSCCHKCTERCELIRDINEQAEEALEEYRAWDVCSGDGLPEGAVGRLEPVDTQALKTELAKFVIPRDRL